METPRNPLFTLLFYLSYPASSQGTPVHYGLVSGDTCPLWPRLRGHLPTVHFCFPTPQDPLPPGVPWNLPVGLLRACTPAPLPFRVYAQSEDAGCPVVRESGSGGGRADLTRKLQLPQGIAVCM